MRTTKPLARLTIPILVLLAPACGPGVGGHFVANETRQIGSYYHGQGSGDCMFAADIFVNTSAKTVRINGGIWCYWFGIEADQCTFEINAIQNGRTYSLQVPTGPCTEGPPGSRTQVFSCDNPSNCTGTWTATAAVVVRGYSGTWWRTRTSECSPQGSGDMVTCTFHYAGTTI